VLETLHESRSQNFEINLCSAGAQTQK